MGTATVTIADLSRPRVGVAIDVRGQEIGAPGWADMPLDAGSFASGTAGSDYLAGNFHGPGHEEAWGVFDTAGPPRRVRREAGAVSAGRPGGGPGPRRRTPPAEAAGFSNREVDNDGDGPVTVLLAAGRLRSRARVSIAVSLGRACIQFGDRGVVSLEAGDAVL